MKKKDAIETERVEFRVSTADLVRWRLSAGVEGVTLSEWIRRRCEESAVDQATFDLVKNEVVSKRTAIVRMKAR